MSVRITGVTPPCCNECIPAELTVDTDAGTASPATPNTITLTFDRLVRLDAVTILNHTSSVSSNEVSPTVGNLAKVFVWHFTSSGGFTFDLLVNWTNMSKGCKNGASEDSEAFTITVV